MDTERLVRTALEHNAKNIGEYVKSYEEKIQADRRRIAVIRAQRDEYTDNGARIAVSALVGGGLVLAGIVLSDPSLFLIGFLLTGVGITLYSNYVTVQIENIDKEIKSLNRDITKCELLKATHGGFKNILLQCMRK